MFFAAPGAFFTRRRTGKMYFVFHAWIPRFAAKKKTGGLCMSINGHLFSSLASTPENPLWEKHTARLLPLYKKPNDCRDPYERDYTRILHSLAYRR